VLGTLAVLAVIAITVAVTVLLTGRSDTGSAGSTSGNPPAPAGGGSAASLPSANDKGPVSIISEDPSCAPWIPIQNTLAEAEQTTGWLQRDPAAPADVWGPDVRAQYTTVAQAMRSAADQTVPLLSLTTHRVMREIYEQFIAYGRRYADQVPTYTPIDDQQARTANAAVGLLGDICQAISFGSAAARGPLVPPGRPPTQVAPVGDPAHPQRFLTGGDPVCAQWKATTDAYEADPTVAEWKTLPNNVAAGQWSAQQKAVNEAMMPIWRSLADAGERLAGHSENPVVRDFAVLAAQYERAGAQAVPTYTPADVHLQNAGLRARGLVYGACAALGQN
jgi:hypothetical protein